VVATHYEVNWMAGLVNLPKNQIFCGGTRAVARGRCRFYIVAFVLYLIGSIVHGTGKRISSHMQYPALTRTVYIAFKVLKRHIKDKNKKNLLYDFNNRNHRRIHISTIMASFRGVY
jgi:hypothetical protein